MDKQKYQIGKIIFEITLNSEKYKISDLFDEPQPYNLYINYHILKCNEGKVNEKIIIKDGNDTSIMVKEDSLIITTNISKIVQKNYNHQFSLFGNKGIIQKYILHILEIKKLKII